MGEASFPFFRFLFWESYCEHLNGSSQLVPASFSAPAPSGDAGQTTPESFHAVAAPTSIQPFAFELNQGRAPDAFQSASSRFSPNWINTPRSASVSNRPSRCVAWRRQAMVSSGRSRLPGGTSAPPFPPFRNGGPHRAMPLASPISPFRNGGPFLFASHRFHRFATVCRSSLRLTVSTVSQRRAVPPRASPLPPFPNRTGTSQFSCAGACQRPNRSLPYWHGYGSAQFCLFCLFFSADGNIGCC
jgi:hypothetical protein